MYGLKKITLHNSYYNGLTVSIDTAGHTNCSGTNAAGKTSMLQMVPFFYGCQPSRFNPKNKDKLPFIDFVLPSRGSMIIYDYRRQDGECCSITYRSANDGVAYRFVKGDSREVFFNETVGSMLKNGAPATDIFAKIATLGFTMSNQLLTIADYAAVIQGDIRTLRRGRDKSRLADAQRFSLTSPSNPMKFMGEMTFTLLKRSRMYEELKSMIAVTLFDYTAPSIPKHRNNERLSRDLRSLRDFEQRKETIRHCIELHRERLHLVSATARYARGVKREVAAMEILHAETATKKEQTHQRLKEQEEHFEITLADLRSKRIEAEQQIQSLRRRIDAAENQHSQWLDENIPEKQIDFERLNEFQDDAETADRHYQMLLSDSREITDQRDSQINAIQARLNQRRDECFKRERECDDKLEKIRDSYQSGNDALRQAETEERHACEEAANAKREQQLPEIGRLSEAIKSGGLTEEESVAEAAAQEKIDAHERTLDKLADDIQEQNVVVENAKSAHQSTLERLEEHRKQLERQSNAIAQLEKALYPADGTLLACLKREFPQWRENIGKVVDPRLLDRKDLNPMPASGDNLYGVDLALEKLQPAEHAEEETILQAKLEQLSAQKRLREVEKKRQEERTSSLKSQWDAAQEALTVLTHRQGQIEKTRQAARQHLLRLRQQHQLNKAERKTALQAELRALETRLSNEKSRLAQRLQEIGERYDQQRRDLLDDRAAQESDIQLQKDQLRAILEADKERARQEVDEVMAAYQRQCEKQGIDEQILRAAKKRADEAREKYRAVRSYGDIIQKYDDWFNNVWSRIATDRAELAEQEIGLAEIHRSIAELEEHHQRAKIQLKRQLTHMDQQMRQQNEQIQSGHQLLKKHGSVFEGDTEAGDLAGLCSELETLLLRESELRNQLLESIAEAVSTIQSNPESKIHEAWKVLSETRRNSGTCPEHREDYQLNLPEDLDLLLNKQLPNIHDAIVQTVKSVGGAFEDFHRTLRQLELDVDRVSRELKTRVNTDQRIAALSGIELRLTSKIAKTVEGWDDLESFILAWKDWNTGLVNTLPPQALEDALRRVIVSFQASNLKMDIESLFDLEIHMVESGRPTRISSNAAFDDASSNGLSYLALIVIFVGMSRYLCPDTGITLTWPLDELATLDPKNISAMFTMLKRNNIEVFSAFPSTDYNLLQHFKNRYTLSRQEGARQFLDTPGDPEQVDKTVALLKAEEATP